MVKYLLWIKKLYELNWKFQILILPKSTDHTYFEYDNICRPYSRLSLWREVSTSAKARVVLQSLLSELPTSCRSFLSMMKVSTLFLHGGQIREINFLNSQTSLIQYTSWLSAEEEKGLTNSDFENSRVVSIHYNWIYNSYDEYFRRRSRTLKAAGYTVKNFENFSNLSMVNISKYREKKVFSDDIW